MTSKILLLFILMSGLIDIPNAAFSADKDDYNRRGAGWYDRWYDNDRDIRHLQGRWYMEGDPTKPTEIAINGRRLEARNEIGQTSRLEADRAGNVHASDWEVYGKVRGNRIDWSNGTTWTRRPSERIGSQMNGRLRRLEGRWYVNGDPNKPAEIYVDGRRVEAKNENGQTSRLEIDRDGDIRASDWQGIRGDVRADRIEWSNGTTWRKWPSERFGRR